MKIYTSYFGNPRLRNLPSNIATASISNTTPEWFKTDLVLDKYKPEWGYVNAFKTGKIPFIRFADFYFETLKKRFADNEDIRQYLINQMNTLDKEYDSVVLLCWERDPAVCHRSALIHLFPNEFIREY